MFSKICLPALGVAFLLMFVSSAQAVQTPKNGGYYFNEMKASMLEVIEENQGLINKKADGSLKEKKLLPKQLYKKIYRTFKSIAGKDFTFKKMKAERNPEKIAHILAALLQGGRVTIAKSQGLINTEADGSKKLKRFIPAVFGKLTADRFKQKTGVAVKQTTLGKGKYGARNSFNKPDKWEAKSLKTIAAKGWNRNQGVGEVVGGSYRYIKPVYIKKACLGCHGVPIGQPGPYGHPKEGYEVGDVRGGISVNLGL